MMTDTLPTPSIHDWPDTYEPTRDTLIQTIIAVACAVDNLRKRGHHRGEVAIELLTNAIVMMFLLPYDEARHRSVDFWERFSAETTASFAAEAAIGNSSPNGTDAARRVLDKMIPPLAAE